MNVLSAPRSAAEATSRAGARTRERAFEATRPVPRWGRIALGVFIWALGAVLLYLVITIWPAVAPSAGGSGAAARTTTITWFGTVSYGFTVDTALLTMVVLVSALGSFVHAATSFTDFVGNRRLATSWVWWYLLRVVIGSALAVLFYFALRGGFFTTTDSAQVNPYGIAAVSGLVGLFSKQATDKLREVFDTAFRVAPGYGDEARDDGIANPEPELRGSEPPRLVRGGTLELVLAGAGFVEESTVVVSQPGGEELPRKVTYLGPDRLHVALEAADVASPGFLHITVYNPEPGGGASRTLQLEVAEEVAE